MAIPTSREEFKEYCLRALGAPVLQINVDDSQVEDRVDEALYLYQESHMDAVQKDYLRIELTASNAVFSPAISGTFANNEPITNANGATGFVVTQTNANTLQFFTRQGSFVNGDVITGSSSGATGNANVVTLGTYDLRYFDIPPGIISVTRMFPPFDGRGVSSELLFDPQAQFGMAIMNSLTNDGMTAYVLGRQYQQLMSDTLRGRPMMRFQRHQNRLYADVNFHTNFNPGSFIVVECYRVLDPQTYTDVWSDRWLQRYAIAQIKRQWGMNLSKYNGIALPGGVSLDGVRMLTEANAEVKELEEELKTTYQLPIDFLIG
jgi:hypothetical protein